MNAQRVEHIKCPKCGEVLPLDRDAENMTVLPAECGCGHKAGLGDLLGQMQEQVNVALPKPDYRQMQNFTAEMLKATGCPCKTTLPAQKLEGSDS